eukprot:CCRYP_013100-RA/>CCRYP_013100-RA protein AED:0.01 eAED:0.01 QI:3655/1/1/1/0.5/0.33/3/3026/39
MAKSCRPHLTIQWRLRLSPLHPVPVVLLSETGCFFRGMM